MLAKIHTTQYLSLSLLSHSPKPAHGITNTAQFCTFSHSQTVSHPHNLSQTPTHSECYKLDEIFTHELDLSALTLSVSQIHTHTPFLTLLSYTLTNKWHTHTHTPTHTAMLNSFQAVLCEIRFSVSGRDEFHFCISNCLLVADDMACIYLCTYLGYIIAFSILSCHLPVLVLLNEQHWVSIVHFILNSSIVG